MYDNRGGFVPHLKINYNDVINFIVYGHVCADFPMIFMKYVYIPAPHNRKH